MTLTPADENKLMVTSTLRSISAAQGVEAAKHAMVAAASGAATLLAGNGDAGTLEGTAGVLEESLSLAAILDIPDLAAIIGVALAEPSNIAPLARTSSNTNKAVQPLLTALRRTLRVSWLQKGLLPLVQHSHFSDVTIDIMMLYNLLYKLSYDDLLAKFKKMVLIAMKTLTKDEITFILRESKLAYAGGDDRALLWASPVIDHEGGDKRIETACVVIAHMIKPMVFYLFDARCTQLEHEVIHEILLSYMKENQYIIHVCQAYNYALDATPIGLYMFDKTKLIQKIGVSILATLKAEMDNNLKNTWVAQWILIQVYERLLDSMTSPSFEEAESSNPINCRIC